MNFYEINEGCLNFLVLDRFDYRSFKRIIVIFNNIWIKNLNNLVCKIYIYYILIYVYDI